MDYNEKYSDAQISALRDCLPDYVNSITTKSARGEYICPLCGSGSGAHKSGAFSINKKNPTQWKCFACGESGDIFDLIGKAENIPDFPQQVRRAGEIFGMSPNGSAGFKINFKKKAAPAPEKKVDYTEFFKQAHQHITDPAAVAYLQKRGITAESADKFNLGYVAEWKHPKVSANVPSSPRLIIPTSKHSYFARDIRDMENIPEKSREYVKQNVGGIELFNISAIDGDKPVYVVEGAIDAISVIQAGGAAVGLGSVSMVNKFVKTYKNKKRALPIIAALDNDGAGKTANSGLYDGLKDITQVRVYCPVENAKDPNEMLTKNPERFAELIRDNEVFPENVQAEPKEQGETAAELSYIFVDGKGEFKVNAALLADFILQNEIILRGGGEKPRYYQYVEGVYKKVDSFAIKGIIHKYIEAFSLSILKDKVVNETFNLLTVRAKKIDETTLNADEHYINFKNGLLRLSDMVLLPHTPDLLSTIQLPCDWTNTPAETPVFDNFLENLLPNEDERRLLVEFIGLALSNIRGSKAKSALFLRGVSNSGKSRLFMLLYRLLGAENAAAIQLQGLEKQYSLAPVIDKRLIGAADMQAAGVSELAVFKGLCGDDPLPVEEKFHSPTTRIYRGVMLFCCNQLPTFGGDKSNAVYDRCVILNCPNAVPAEKQDPYIVDKMFDERQGILYKAIYALKDFKARGCKYDLPQSVIQSRERYAEYNSPVRQFVNDCCIYVDPESPRPFYTSRQDIFNAFKRYCEDCNIDIRGITLQKFGAELAEINGISREKNEITARDGNGHLVRLYLCIDLRPDYYEIQKAI